MPRPNLFLLYVTDATSAASFYSELFEMKPSFVSPRYVAFDIAPGVLFAVWSGNEIAIDETIPRTSEVGLMLPGPASRIDETYKTWKSKGVAIVEKPHDAVFGRTFVVTDPDGNLLRVSPVD